MNKQIEKRIKEANRKAVERVLKSRPILVDIKQAREALPNLKKNLILHPGPPIDWKRMSGPLRGAIVGTMIFEELAENWEDAIKLIESRQIEFSPSDDHSSVGPMAGVISPSMPVLIVKNQTFGNTNFGRFVENKVQYGVFSKDAVQVLRFWAKTLGPVLGKAIRASNGIDLKLLMAKALHMGDELHNRSIAGTTLFTNVLATYLIDISDKEESNRVINYLQTNDIFFLCVSMTACKNMMNAACDTEYSTLVTNMARNGTDFGIKVSGLGNEWFVGRAQKIDGKYFPGYNHGDANPDIGDSAIIETAGIGAFALANSPAIIELIGSSVDEALKYTSQMREITITRNDTFSVPILDFQGTPTGIDIRKVIQRGILPVIDTAIAHKQPGIGMIGTGLVRPPIEAFKLALHAFGRKYKLKNKNML